LLLELRNARLESAQLCARFLDELRVVNENELAYLRELVFVFAESACQLDSGSETSVLSAQVGQLVRVTERNRISQSPLDLGRASQYVGESVSK
jgi:hypothetical protein